MTSGLLVGVCKLVRLSGSTVETPVYGPRVVHRRDVASWCWWVLFGSLLESQVLQSQVDHILRPWKTEHQNLSTNRLLFSIYKQPRQAKTLSNSWPWFVTALWTDLQSSQHLHTTSWATCALSPPTVGGPCISSSSTTLQHVSQKSSRGQDYSVWWRYIFDSSKWRRRFAVHRCSLRNIEHSCQHWKDMTRRNLQCLYQFKSLWRSWSQRVIV